jgi:hypothetical protein
MSPADPSGDPDISLVLRGDDDPAAARLKALQQATIAGNGAIPIWQPSPRRDRPRSSLLR